MLFANSKRIRFFVIGDWGRGGTDRQKETADCMADIADRVKPDFVVSTGDNFYDCGVKDEHDLQWELSFETVYHQKSLQIPWYAVLGNHDYMLNPEAQVVYTQKSRRWKMPSRFYHQTLKIGPLEEALLVFIDTNTMISEHYHELSPLNIQGQDMGRQLQWLEESLRSSRAKWKLVFGHHVLFSGGSMHGNNPELIERLTPIFEQYGVQAYFCGHEHDLQHLKPKGKTHYFVSGAGSEIRETDPLPYTAFCASENGFLDVVILEDFMQVRFIQSDGTVINSAHIESVVNHKPLVFINKP